ncbi:MAG: glycerol-3-phosphate 1-O-acyltransferase PlsB [Xanthomonadales bacterium]|nr:glycerol-3-phosphate 1-O-acyltransferase PlsB [Xanthomonadales bacterium]
MGKQNTKLKLLDELKLRWFLLLRNILGLWVKPRIKTDPDGNTGSNGDRPVCYIMDSYALSSVLILDKYCEQQKLARPLLPVAGIPESPIRSYAVLKRLKGIFFRSPDPRSHSEMLQLMVEKNWANPELDIQLVPVTILVGHRPSKDSGLTRVIFTENWEIGGRLRRFFSTLVNGRRTFLQFSRPISLKDLAAEGLDSPVALRKVSRILRVHFKRVRTAAIGPDLSHRRTMVEQVVNSPTVRAATEEETRRAGITPDQARRRAVKFVREIAANYSYSAIVIAENLISWLWNRIYNGIKVNNFDGLQHNSLGHEVIYVPCHRSHLDYVLLSYLVHENGFIPPHIAAGINLNLPLVGPLMRRCGAFFLRRSFRSQKLYAAVFHEYLSMIQTQGVSIEYFIEGTRSRTGRLLPPKAGMLAMSVRSYLNAPVMPIMFQPVYIGYERLAEGDSYTTELSGKAKRSEKFSDLGKIFGLTRHNYGKAHVSLCEPIFLDDLLNQQDPQWQETIRKEARRPDWLNSVIEELGQKIMTHINAGADVNPVNLLALALLGTPRHAMGEKQLERQITLYQVLLNNRPTPEKVTVTQKTAEEIIEYGFEMRILQRQEHELGDVISLLPDRAVGQTFFRNNISHLVTLPSLVACCFLEHRNFLVRHLHKFAIIIQPFLQAELFIPWGQRQITSALDDSVEQLVENGLLIRNKDGETLSRAKDNPEAVLQLNVLAHSLLQTIHRYLITISILARYGSGVLSRGELETLCIQTAQRISMLHEFNAPEFYDKALFKQFIAELRNTGYLSPNQDNKLVFDERLEQMSQDAKFILGEGIRLEIDRQTPFTEVAEPVE